MAALLAITAAALATLGIQPTSAQSPAAVTSGAATARVLIIGARPEDEDNGLLAWLSLGRHVETAYLSLTRGEAGVNLTGSERQAALGVVRTAELLAERARDGAHQYFTRAYDFGSVTSDSVVDAAWPHDSLLTDVAMVVRAFRPQVVISLFSNADSDATHRVAARLARESFAAAADSQWIPARRTSRLPPWSVSRLFTPVRGSVRTEDSALSGIDVGEFDPATQRSFAELGAEIRRLQRTQPARAVATPISISSRAFHLDSARGDTRPATFFRATDTSWSRFRGAVEIDVQRMLDSLERDIRLADDAGRGTTTDSLAAAFARVAKRANDVRLTFRCNDEEGVPLCPGVLGDLALSLNNLRIRATRQMLIAAGIVIDGTVERELVAAGDYVPATVTIRNGGHAPIAVRRIAVNSRTELATIARDTSMLIAPDSTASWTAQAAVRLADYHWWQVNGLQDSTWMHVVYRSPSGDVAGQFIAGEDRIASSGVEATLRIGGVDVPTITRPLVYRSAGMTRGDERRPLAGTAALSVLLERPAEYERAGLPIDRLFRVYVSSVRTTPDTMRVSLRTPHGLTPDSASRIVIIPPLAGRSVFFRLHGTLAPGADTIVASVQPAAPLPQTRVYTSGVIIHEYPHIASQQFIRQSKVKLQAVDLRVPARLRIAYIKGTDDVPTWLGQLQINVQTLEPALLPVVDLSAFTTVLIGAGAMSGDALAGTIPALHAFMARGGTVVLLAGGPEILSSGLFPFPVASASPVSLGDPDAEILIADRRSPLLGWPNVITMRDFDGWIGERARGLLPQVDARYRPILSVRTRGGATTDATILMAPVGRGVFIYTPLSVDRQLAEVDPGAARLFVNMLSAGLRPASR